MARRSVTPMVMDGANPLRLANKLPRRSIHRLVLHLIMKTQYIIQKRHPNLGEEWAYRDWHDRTESYPHSHMGDAVKECKRLILNAETTQYRLIERKTSEEEISLENNGSPAHGKRVLHKPEP